jgi:hypothetical protein
MTGNGATCTLTNDPVCGTIILTLQSGVQNTGTLTGANFVIPTAWNYHCVNGAQSDTTTSLTINVTKGAAVDYTVPYLGTWFGSATTTVNGTAATSATKVPIVKVDNNTIEVKGFCSQTDAYSSGPNANVGGDGSLVPGSCNVGAVGQCSSVTLNVISGHVSMAGPVFSVNWTGSFVGCGSTIPISQTFSSNNDQPYGSVVATPGGHAAASAEVVRAFSQ